MKMMKKIKPFQGFRAFFKSVLVILFTGFCFLPLKAQLIPLRNGTETTLAYIDTIRKYYPVETNFVPDSIDAHLGIYVYRIRDLSGEIDVNDVFIEEAVNTVNAYFENTGIHFYIFNSSIINDYNYRNLLSESMVDELTTMYSAENMINLYLVDVPLDTLNYGFTYYPDEPEKNFIFLNQEALIGNYLTTLMGNYFGLLPTHEIRGGQEYADSSNCESAGDFICDTWSDPNLYGLVALPDCQYTGNYTDSQMDFFVPSVANIMSNSEDQCKCVLTPLQYKRIQFTYIKHRSYLR